MWAGGEWYVHSRLVVFLPFFSSSLMPKSLPTTKARPASQPHCLAACLFFEWIGGDEPLLPLPLFHRGGGMVLQVVCFSSSPFLPLLHCLLSLSQVYVYHHHISSSSLPKMSVLPFLLLHASSKQHHVTVTSLFQIYLRKGEGKGCGMVVAGNQSIRHAKAYVHASALGERIEVRLPTHPHCYTSMSLIINSVCAMGQNRENRGDRDE